MRFLGLFALITAAIGIETARRIVEAYLLLVVLWWVLS